MSLPSTHNYETVYILKPGVSDANAGTIHQKVDNVIAKFEGSLKQRDDWGVKELAYEIDHESNGRFYIINYNGKSGVVEEIERHFRILEDVMRYMTVMVPLDYDYQKSKKQISASEEEMKRARELRKKGQP